jgi:hypothetical protein
MEMAQSGGGWTDGNDLTTRLLDGMSAREGRVAETGLSEKRPERGRRLLLTACGW